MLVPSWDTEVSTEENGSVFVPLEKHVLDQVIGVDLVLLLAILLAQVEKPAGTDLVFDPNTCSSGQHQNSNT